MFFSSGWWVNSSGTILVHQGCGLSKDQILIIWHAIWFTVHLLARQPLADMNPISKSEEKINS